MKTLLNLLIWLILSALTGYVAWQIHASLLVVVAAWLQSDLPRPLGWATWTLAPISRASIFVLGSGWLIAVLWLEQDLGRYQTSTAFWGRVGKLVAGLSVVLVICWGLIAALS